MLDSILKILELALNNWWIFLLFGLLLLANKITNKLQITIGDNKLDLAQMRILAEAITFFLIIYLAQRYIFYEVKVFFYIALVIFIITLAALFIWIDSKNDIYALESRLQGDLILNELLDRKIPITSTENRLLRMPERVYKAKQHTGNLDFRFWNFGKLIFTDYFDDSTFYHPEIPYLANYSFYQQKIAFLKIKLDYPKILRQMTEHTILREHWLEEALAQLNEKVELAVLDMKYAHPQPLSLPPTLEDLYKNVREEKFFIEKMKRLDEDSKKDGIEDGEGAES